jgi:holliday junction DNA helicase RuvA
MIGLLIGKIYLNTHNPITILTGGIGYQVYVPPRLQAGLKLGEEYTLFIYTHVRDDAIELYGFADNSELMLFNLLISVSGVGPKTALLVIDRGDQAVRNAVMKSDVDFFTAIPRLGHKNAQKIIIELKSKLGSTTNLDLSGVSENEARELIDALTGMGFSRTEAHAALQKIDGSNKSVEDKLRQALKLLNRK